MKTKGISVVETMIEKIVLAVALVIFLVVFALQFFGSPTVDLPGGMGNVPIQQAPDAVAGAARTKIAQLESVGDVDQVPPPVNLSGELVARFTGPVADRSTRLAGLVPGWDGLAGISDVAVETTTGDGLYAMPTPLAPSRPVVAVTLGTVDPSIPLLYPEAAALLPQEQPMDKAIVSLQLEWDASENQALMGATPSGEGELTLPQAWRDTIEIWDVEVVRRELGSDGSWGPETVVPPMPGRASMRERLQTATPPDLPTLESEERNRRAGIRQPRMYNLIAGDFWTAPVLLQREQELDRPAEVDRLLRQVRGLRQEIDSLQRRLDILDGRRASIQIQAPDRLFDIESITPGSIQWPQFADFARAQAGAGGGGAGGGAPPREDPAEAQRRGLRERIERLNGRLTRAIEQLEDLGYDDLGNRIGEEADGIETFQASAGVSAAASDAGALAIWAHDLTAEPGSTYQYAVRLKLRNPLFGNVGSIAAEQRELAEQPVIATSMSDWSAPISVPNLSEYFIIAAADGALGLTAGTGPTATAEVFRYFYGSWRQESLRLNAGDSLRSSITLPADLPIFRLRKGEDGRLVNDGENMLTETSLQFTRDVFLLDVVAGVEQFVLAYFRGERGQILVRDPLRDRGSTRLASMRESAQLAPEQIVRPLDLTDEMGPTPPGRPGRPDGPRPPQPDGFDAPPPDEGPPAGPGSPFG